MIFSAKTDRDYKHFCVSRKLFFLLLENNFFGIFLIFIRTVSKQTKVFYIPNFL